MQKIRTGRVGIDQGLVDLFSDFQDGGDMWTGQGERERRARVHFSESFARSPVVQVAISLWDVDQSVNLRADIFAEAVGRDGFDLVFRTWADSRFARLRASWIAFGEIAFDDDWDV